MREHEAEIALEERGGESAAGGCPPLGAEGIEGLLQVFGAGVLAQRERRLERRVEAVARRGLHRARRQLRSEPGRLRRPANHRSPNAAKSLPGSGVQ